MFRRIAYACLLQLATTEMATGGSAAAEDDRGPATASHNYVLGTQTFAPKYQFTNKTRLVETAEAIQAMGSNIIKFDMSRRAFAGYGLEESPSIRSLSQMARDESSCRQVLQMPFRYCLIWAYPHTVANSHYHTWRNGFSQEERDKEYREIYEFTRYLLTAFDGSGKTFLLGHWEGDWALLGSFDRRDEPSFQAIRGMIDWLNTRQEAIENAKRDTKHEGVQVCHYTEVNLVQKAIQGATTVTNNVLPQTNVDFVSYSSYDSLNTDQARLRETLHKALNYIESKLPPKKGVVGKRVFIGEYGFPLVRMGTPEKQEHYSRTAARAALEWGCPFVLYWQMYCNENDGGKHKGFWLVDNQGRQQPLYDTHRRFFARARQFVAEFHKEHGAPPTPDQYRQRAVEWLSEAD